MGVSGVRGDRRVTAVYIIKALARKPLFAHTAPGRDGPIGAPRRARGSGNTRSRIHARTLDPHATDIHSHAMLAMVSAFL